MGTLLNTFNKAIENFRNKAAGSISDPVDLYEAIRPLYIYSQIHGLACYQSITTGGKTHYSITPLAIMRTMIQVGVFGGLFIYGCVTQKNDLSATDIFVALPHFQDVISNLMATVEILFGAIFAQYVVKVFKNMDEVDTQFKNLSIMGSYKFTYIIVICNILCGFTFTILQVQFEVFIRESSSNLLYGIFERLIHSLPYLINGVVECQYVHFMLILRNKYKALNKYLESELLLDKQQRNVWGYSVNKIDVKRSTLRSFKELNKNPVGIVDTVAGLYIRLSDTAFLINRAFCVQLLLLITIAFIGLVTALFIIAINFSKAASAQSTDYNFMFTLWAFANVLQLISIVYVTCILCEEANRCPRILHKIRNNSTDANLHDTIEIYSLQMYHNRLQFTVCGLFPLDYTLLYTIVAGVTTYLVILIQFNNSEAARIQKTVDSVNSTGI